MRLAAALFALLPASAGADTAVLPQPQPGETAIVAAQDPTPAQLTALLAALAEDNAAEIAAEGHPLHFTVAEADLNGDGRPDLIARLTDSDWCGSAGCSAVAILAETEGYSQTPIWLPNYYDVLFLRPDRHHGLLDLRFDNADHIFRWSGTDYQ